jgi:uncharacterized protein DUF397
MPTASHPDLTTAVWRASSYSNPQGGDCVEIADNLPAPTPLPVRDSKNPTGPALFIPAEGWAGFITAVKAGDLR